MPERFVLAIVNTELIYAQKRARVARITNSNNNNNMNSTHNTK